MCILDLMKGNGSQWLKETTSTIFKLQPLLYPNIHLETHPKVLYITYNQNGFNILNLVFIVSWHSIVFKRCAISHAKCGVILWECAISWCLLTVNPVTLSNSLRESPISYVTQYYPHLLWIIIMGLTQLLLLIPSSHLIKMPLIVLVYFCSYQSICKVCMK